VQAKPLTHCYILVRTDIPPAYQAVQSAHAAIKAARSGLLSCDDNPSLVVCGVPDQKALLDASARLCIHAVPHALFYEDDVDSFTALCTADLEKPQRRILRDFKLL